MESFIFPGNFPHDDLIFTRPSLISNHGKQFNQLLGKIGFASRVLDIEELHLTICTSLFQFLYIGTWKGEHENFPSAPAEKAKLVVEIRCYFPRLYF